jgi:monodechloroaminopyrrolnitrin synthase
VAADLPVDNCLESSVLRKSGFVMRSSLETDALTDPRIAELDPIGLDGLLPTVRSMNSADDLNGLVGLLRHVLPLIPGTFYPHECLAVMRDLGLLMGSIKRHGVEPVVAVPELGHVLLGLGTRTGMVPRNTLLHYTVWNPSGPRQRLYTGDYMERMLIAAVCVTVFRLAEAAEVCKVLINAGPDEVEFAVAVNELVALLRCLEDSMDIVMANVTPEFFAVTARPYYEAIDVGGRTYLGPAAAHVPLYLIDLAVWASDHCDEDRKRFLLEWAHYGIQPWHSLSRQWASGTSLLTRVEAAWKSAGGDASPSLRGSVEALWRLLRGLVLFRGKHFTVTRAAYDVDLRLYDVGSGGGDLGLLSYFSAETKEITGLLRRSLTGVPVRT